MFHLDTLCMTSFYPSFVFHIMVPQTHTSGTKIFKDLNPEMVLLANGFQKLLAGNLSIEDSHDRVRTHLHQLNDEKF